MKYDNLIRAVKALPDPLIGVTGNFANIAALLYTSLENINWVGYYEMKGNFLFLGPFMGKPACTRIPVGKGVCGTAAAENRMQIVPDVHLFPGHIACDSDSRSELVIPVRDQLGKPVFVLDIDSPVLDRFGPEEIELFTEAACVSEKLLGEEKGKKIPLDQRSLLAFLKACAPLKDVPRHCQTIRGKPEYVAGHCWRMAMMAQLLTDSCPEVNMDKVIRMCLIHDIGEAVTEDIPSFRKTAVDEETEDRAVEHLLSLLDEREREELKALFGEMNTLQTPEAKFYKALDKIEAVISHNESSLSSWEEHEKKLNLSYGTEQAACDPYLAELRRQVRLDTEEKLRNGK